MGFGGSGWGFSSAGDIAAAELEGRMRFGIQLIGVKNGVNTVFTTPEFFTSSSLQLHFNQLRYEQGSSNAFLVSESGGPGTGYDTVTLLFTKRLPKADDDLFVDYIAAA